MRSKIIYTRDHICKSIVLRRIPCTFCVFFCFVHKRVCTCSVDVCARVCMFLSHT